MAGPHRRCRRCLTMVNKGSLKQDKRGWICRSRAMCLKRLAKDVVGK